MARNEEEIKRIELQWGRRVNTAESERITDGTNTAAVASMGPPREHGGKLGDRRTLVHIESQLQWGRRVNTAESQTADPNGQQALDMLQWGRRVNTAESSLPTTDCPR